MLVHSALAENDLPGAKGETGPRNISTMQKKSPNVTVLIVDDESLIRWSLAETLADQGFGVLEAGNGREAVAVLGGATRAVDVILLDFRLPDSNDLQLLQRLRALSPSSRIVLMTAYGTPEVMADAIRLGAVGVVNKPLEMQDVPTLVSRAYSSTPS